MHTKLESFLFEFIAAPVVIPLVIAVAAPLLELLVPFVAVIAAKGVAPVIPVACLTVVFRAEALHERCCGKLELTVGEIGQLSLDSVVMDGLLVPVVIGKLHV